MAQLRIAHLSDLHVLKDYRGSYLEAKLNQPIYPAPFFLAGLREAAASNPDVIVLTGDLVHEGTEEDYRYLRDCIDQIAGTIPVLPVLGNHDFKSCFYRGYQNQDRTGPLFYEREINGYRFVVLDTSTEKNSCGSISYEQVLWLEEVLKTPSPNGTILLGHHPIESRQAWFHTTVSQRFCDAVMQGDVIAYLCGHAHYFETRTLLGMQQVTAESFAFGVETMGDRVIYTEARGYNTCWLEEQNLIVHAHAVSPFHPSFFGFSLND